MKNNNQNEFQETELEYPQQVRAESLSFQVQNHDAVSPGGTEEERSGVNFPEEVDDPENDEDDDDYDSDDQEIDREVENPEDDDDELDADLLLEDFGEEDEKGNTETIGIP